MKCPYCGHDNEEGTLFCEQCKSDLAVVQANAVPMAEPVAAAEPSAPPAESEAVRSVSDTLHGAPVASAIADTLPPGTVSLSSTASSGSTATATPPSEEPTVVPLPTDAKPKLVVVRGLRIHAEYPIFEGENFVGRTDEKPVDIDLEDQEPPDRIWSSRQHAVIHFNSGFLVIEDLNSSNGTFVNRTRVYPNQKRALQIGDVIQIGTVQLRLKL